MQKIGDLMKELGFNKDASFEAKKAFIQHLVRVADRQKPVTPIAPQSESPLPTQLSFDLEILGVATTGTSRR